MQEIIPHKAERIFVSGKIKILDMILEQEQFRKKSNKKFIVGIVLTVCVLSVLVYFFEIHIIDQFFDYHKSLKHGSVNEFFWVIFVSCLLYIPIFWYRERKVTGNSQLLFEKISDIIVEDHRVQQKELNGLQKLTDRMLDALHEGEHSRNIMTNTLAQMEQQFNDLAELSGNIYCTVDREGQLTSMSTTVTTLYGYTIEEVMNKPIESFLCTKQNLSKSDQQCVERAFRGQRLVEFSMVIPHKNGSLLESLLSVVPVHDSDARLTGFYCSVILLTQEYLMERAIKERIHLVSGELGKDDKGFLNITLLLDAILQEQLQAVTKVTEDAAFNLLSQIQAVDAQLGSVMEFLLQNDAATRSQGMDAQQAIEEDRAAIDNLRKFVADIQTRKEEERERGMRVLQEIQGLGGFVSIVHEISDRTNVLALNAGIIAARAGEHGTQFAVVASEVRKLSRQVKNAAEEIGKGIVGVQETIAAIFEKNDNNQAEMEESFLANTANKMIQMGDNYTKILDSSATNMAKITFWSQELAEKTMCLLSEFQFQDISRQQIEQVIKALERRKEYSQKLRDVLLDAGKDYRELEHFSLDSLRADYVMATQHQVHTQQLGLGHEAPVTVPLIELF